MVGTYYKTIFRNQETGETKFYIVPSEPCPYVKNGLLLCYGKIGIYLKNTPICIEGSYESGVYVVNKDYIPVETKENVISILEYISDEFTEVQKEEIASVSEGNIFAFVERPDCECILRNILKRSKKCEILIRRIISGVNQLKNKEEITLELLKYGIPIDRIELLYKKDITLNQLKENPYIIFLKYNISIDKAEMFAQQNCDLEEYSLCRLTGFLYDAMLYILSAGHTCCTPEQLVSVMNSRMNTHGIYKTKIDLSIVNLCVLEMNKYVSYHIVNDKVYVYLNYVWKQETKAIENIKRLQKNKRYFDTNVSIYEIEQILGISYNNGQKNVFNSLNASGIKILTGPPGSGKTATIQGLIEYFKRNNNGTVKLAATTGMAAKVMSNACKADSETVNIMLNVIPFDGESTGRDLNNPIDADLIIVDEVSMLGLELFSILTQAVKSGSILLLVGDDDQLQSVDAGNILFDLINSGIIETYRLTEIIRQSGTICENAEKVNKGDKELKNDASFMLFDCQNNEIALDLLKKNLKKESSQILCPVKKGEISTESINDMLQDKTAEILVVYGKKTYHVGDKVIMTKTNYAKNYINGDIGYVIGLEDELLIVQFASKVLALDRQDMHDMDLAEAVTIHKSQGSEFLDVHILLPKEAECMMTRRLLYTAITRAKRRVFIYNIGGSVEKAINNKGEIRRMTLLKERLLA